MYSVCITGHIPAYHAGPKGPPGAPMKRYPKLSHRIAQYLHFNLIGLTSLKGCCGLCLPGCLICQSLKTITKALRTTPHNTMHQLQIDRRLVFRPNPTQSLQPTCGVNECPVGSANRIPQTWLSSRRENVTSEYPGGSGSSDSGQYLLESLGRDRIIA